MNSPESPARPFDGRPHELGVDEFEHYALVIDARSPHEFAEDHVPGALNLPVVDDAEFAEVGIRYAKDPHSAYLIGAEHALRNIARHVRTHIAAYPVDARFLVYCFRGGKRSRVWADVLRAIGSDVQVLQGGWRRYRHWVRESLAALPERFDHRVIAGATGCGKTRLLAALAREGAQVLDLEGLAQHRGSLIGDLPGTAQPSQKYFESLLLDRLRRFDVRRPVWVEAESKKIGRLQLPEALYLAMRSAPLVEVGAGLADRVRLLKEDYAHWVADPSAMVDRLEALKPLVGGEELARWRAMACAGDVDALFERLLVAHYDPAYERSRRRAYDHKEPLERLELPALDASALDRVAADLARRHAAPGGVGP